MDIESLISQTEALSWQDLNFEPTPETARTISDSMLLERLVADRPLNKFVVHSSIMELHPKIPHRRFGSQYVSIHFSLSSGQTQVLNQAPWNFKGHLLIIKPWSPGSTLQEISLRHSIFNIQIHGLPLDHMTLKNAT
ncbi:hypothetical protein F2P56_028341 [Juglans regia]|uniref:DUF4283 domain-containing protein n=1 Tax=Juglans regia TaxID=51240 RepID=A0A833U5A1_JUGRE|nr:hypothetical protein F2P56_028341 [Juglans regia]